jgi:hypothetical protein
MFHVSRFTFHVSRIMYLNGITDADPTGADDLSEDALTLVHHPGAQSLANGVHLSARVARGIHTQDRFSNLNLTAKQGNQVDARSLDVRPHCARGDGGQAESRGVFRDLLTLDQAYLPSGRLAGLTTQPSEIARIA